MDAPAKTVIFNLASTEQAARDFLAAIKDEYPATDTSGMNSPLVLTRGVTQDGGADWRRRVDDVGTGVPNLDGVLDVYQPSTVVLFLPQLDEPMDNREAKAEIIAALRHYVETNDDTKIVIFQPTHGMTEVAQQKTQREIDKIAKELCIDPDAIVWVTDSRYAELAKHIPAAVPLQEWTGTAAIRLQAADNSYPSKPAGRRKAGVVIAAATGALAGAGISEVFRQHVINSGVANQTVAQKIIDTPLPSGLSPDEVVTHDRNVDVAKNVSAAEQKNIDWLQTPATIAKIEGGGAAVGALAGGGIAAWVRRRDKKSEEQAPGKA